jgi:hypothetical protein
MRETAPTTRAARASYQGAIYSLTVARHKLTNTNYFAENPAKLNKREGYICEMPILVNTIRWLSFFAVFCVAWFNVVVVGPLAAVKTTEQDLMISAQLIKALLQSCNTSGKTLPLCFEASRISLV